MNNNGSRLQKLQLINILDTLEEAMCSKNFSFA